MEALVQLDQLKIVHKDLNPRNILIRQSFKDYIQPSDVFVIDFGFSVCLKEPSAVANIRTGTSGYFAPEILHAMNLKEPLPLSSKSDLYSCGLLIFELYLSLTLRIYGLNPFRQFDNLLQVEEKGDKEWNRLVNQKNLKGELEWDKYEPYFQIDSQLKDVLGRILSRDPIHRPNVLTAISELFPTFFQTEMAPQLSRTEQSLNDSHSSWVVQVSGIYKPVVPSKFKKMPANGNKQTEQAQKPGIKLFTPIHRHANSKSNFTNPNEQDSGLDTAIILNPQFTWKNTSDLGTTTLDEGVIHKTINNREPQPSSPVKTMSFLKSKQTFNEFQPSTRQDWQENEMLVKTTSLQKDIPSNPQSREPSPQT